MSADELLPLPEGSSYEDSGLYVEAYTAAQVNEQSRANVAHATAGLRAELAAAREDAARLRNGIKKLHALYSTDDHSDELPDEFKDGYEQACAQFTQYLAAMQEQKW